jgi:hypothetical protein
VHTVPNVLQGELLDVELLPGSKGRSGGVVVLRMRRPRDFSYRLPPADVVVRCTCCGCFSSVLTTPYTADCSTSAQR